MLELAPVLWDSSIFGFLAVTILRRHEKVASKGVGEVTRRYLLAFRRYPLNQSFLYGSLVVYMPFFCVCISFPDFLCGCLIHGYGWYAPCAVQLRVREIEPM